MISNELAQVGMKIIDRNMEAGDLSHERGLVTMVVSYSYTDGVRGHLGINLRDYTTGVILSDGEQERKNSEPRYTYSESKFGGTLSEKMKELTKNFGKWYAVRHSQFVPDSVLLRPRWWTNEKRKTTDEK